MCNCPAHFDLVDCVCECEHTYDRMDQWRDRAHAAEARLAAVEVICDDWDGLQLLGTLYQPQLRELHRNSARIRAALAATREHLDAMTRDAEDDGLYDAIDGTTA